MSLLPRVEVQGITPATHGGLNYAELEELGIPPEEVLDFSANLNPFGPPQETKSRPTTTGINRKNFFI